MRDIVPEEASDLASEARDIIATYREAEDLITIGAYKPGQNARVDRAVHVIDKINAFLKQSSSQKVTMEESWKALIEILRAKE
jgi:flagellum-specific ATP synthase